ncbi:metallophosphoesterase [Shinella sp.]|uniref:metallophosphoesterase n=1 Tax=Shinella sp. TaxID=1870904 RepID=UPI003F72CF8D
MKAWIFSDLHLEIDPNFPLMEIPQADVCLCAGDIFDGGVAASMLFLRDYVVPHMPVVFVPGNHEFYRGSIKEGLATGYMLAESCDDLFMVNGDAVEINGYRFIGATLWTDFNLHNDPRLAMGIAREELNDFKRIKLSKTPFKKFTPQESQHLHRVATVHIDNMYRSQPQQPTVIISHHAPSLMSVPRQYLKDGLTPSFASRFEYRILEYEPLLWVHGHIHSPSDYRIGKTRVVCNPLGYPDEPSRKTFNPSLVIDLAELAKT